MTPYQGILLIIFGVIGYAIIADENVAPYLTLVFKLIKINIERTYWMIKFHPRNPITNLLKRWEYDRLAKELQREFDDTLRQID